MKKGIFKTIALSIFLIALVSVSQPALAQSLIFAQIEGIEGSGGASQECDGCIQVLGLGLSIGHTAGTSGGGSTSGKAEFRPLKILKEIDIASPKIYLAAAKGTHIPQMNINFYTQGDSSLDIYYELLLEDVVITNVTPSVNSSEGGAMTELVSFMFGKITWTYTPYKEDGSKEPAVTTHWDLELNQGG